MDTSYFVGNAPGQVRVSAADAEAGPLEDPGSWWDLLPVVAVLADTRHRFSVADRRPATHLRLDVYPDGGLSRLRCWGELPGPERDRLTRRFEDSLPGAHRVFPLEPAEPLVSPALRSGPV